MPIYRKKHRKGNQLVDIYLRWLYNGVYTLAVIVAVTHSFILLFSHSIFFFTTLILISVKHWRYQDEKTQSLILIQG